MRVCPHCGARYEDDAAFCPMDGSPLREVSSPSVSAPGSGPTSAASGSGGSSGASGSLLRWQPPTRVGSGPQPAASNGWASSGAAVAVAAPGDSAPEIEAEEALIGVVLGDRYRVDERIGAGGMGIVYQATHVLIGRKLAVKLLRRRYAAQADVAERFASEARIASSVKHPNVVDIIDYGTTPQGSPYYVMEHLAGRSLAREIAGGAVEPRRALGVAVQIARGLAAAHQAGIVHRDLKPDNVFLVSPGPGAPEQVKILDFGIARIAGRKTRLTAAGAVVGTPEYMSPEQARGDELDARSDIYALGVVLFELLTGRVPLSGDSMVGTLTKQVFELPPQIREIDPRFAGYPSIEAALARLLAKNRDERPATALDAADLLQTAAANDLEPIDEPRERAALAGWSQPAPSADPIRGKRSTVMIGSGAITTAHRVVETDGPATGDFAAKIPGEIEPPKRPSVIVTDAPPGNGRPARVLQVARRSPPKPPATPQPTSAISRTPTPARGTPRLGKQSRRPAWRRHLPLILVAIGAAIFAALVTIGFVRWMQRRDARKSNVTSMKDSPLDGRYAARAHTRDRDTPAMRTRFEPRQGPNTAGQSPVEAPTRASAQIVSEPDALRSVANEPTRERRRGENAVG